MHSLYPPPKQGLIFYKLSFNILGLWQDIPPATQRHTRAEKLHCGAAFITCKRAHAAPPPYGKNTERLLSKICT
ncbi:hypothetical protein APS_0707 [Acetobacter pasteurianus subsp. pasteurianus LMG 1262 = NBRC 106471]|nr:hypothetical protein APS_0707 [Acetobacter pasteurianus subsp. pasteurianus LMG 1262 = NBRC 106471]